MLMIGRGVQLESLPAWAQHIALSSRRYAVDVLQASAMGTGLTPSASIFWRWD